MASIQTKLTAKKKVGYKFGHNLIEFGSNKTQIDTITVAEIQRNTTQFSKYQTVDAQAPTADISDPLTAVT